MSDGWKETGLRGSPTAEAVCERLRSGRWDQLSKQQGFSTTGDSLLIPPAIPFLLLFIAVHSWIRVPTYQISEQ